MCLSCPHLTHLGRRHAGLVQATGHQVRLEPRKRGPGGLLDGRRRLVIHHPGLRPEETLELVGLLLEEMV